MRHLQRHCTTSINLLTLLSSGSDKAVIRAHVDIVVQNGGVEACVNAMRANQVHFCTFWLRLSVVCSIHDLQ